MAGDMKVPGGSQEQHQDAAEGSVGEVNPGGTGGASWIEGFGLFPVGQQGREMSIIF